MNSNEVYVIKQPSKSILSVIVMDNEFPLSRKTHNYLDSLQQISDTFFIFNDSLFSSRFVNKRKFVTLYEGGSLVSSDSNKTILPCIIKAFEYSLEIFNKHYTFLVFKMSDLDKYSEEEFNSLLDNVRKVSMTPDLERPIMKIDRLSENEMYAYYKNSNLELKDNEVDDSFVFQWSDLGLGTVGTKLSRLMGNYLAKKDNDSDLTNIYASWKTTSRIQVFRKSTILRFLDYLNKYPDYMGTFIGDRIDQFFASLVMRLQLKNHNMDIELLTIGEKKNEDV